MRRREFVALAGGAAAAWPLAVTAQGERMRRVGVLMAFAEGDAEGQLRLAAFRQGLTDVGWVEGRNLRIDARWAGADVLLQQSHARELVALAPDAILANSTTATQALAGATKMIPIVFVGLSDPVATGVVSNLARPDANVIGFTTFEYSLAGKWLSLLKDMAPRLVRVALLFNPDTVPHSELYVRAAQAAGKPLAVTIAAAWVRNRAEIEAAIAAMVGDGGLLLVPDVFHQTNGATTIALADKYRVPAIYYERRYATDGGLMSYGADLKLQYRDGATYVDRILRGARPSDLPVQFATKFELVINLKTAKALGFDVSQNLLSIADEVIE
jgi:ABC-type uncharacterized transport system substrate-binding protein